MFFDLSPPISILGDLNPELINCYQVTRARPDELIKKLKTLKNSEDRYYEIRASRPRSDVARAARLIYLCTLSFNSIYRVNREGAFNVPYGHKAHLAPFDANLIQRASERLQTCELLCDDFEAVALRAKRGDCVYFDPPYTVAHGNNGFVKYNEKIFSWKDQLRLRLLAGVLADKGVKVVVSNADHPSLRELYSDFHTLSVQRWSVVSAKSTGRRSISECIFHIGK